MALLRYGLPASIFAVGLVLVAVGSDYLSGAGIVLMGTAVLVLSFNLLTRLGLSSQGDRDREEAARRHFTRHGRWPDRQS